MELVQKTSSGLAHHLAIIFLNDLILLTRIVLQERQYVACKKGVVKDLPLNSCCETLSCYKIFPQEGDRAL